MTNIEKLIEAVVYADENGLDWWEIFDSPSEAMKIIRSAKREKPEEGQIVCLLSASDDDDLFGSCTAYETYNKTIRAMQDKLSETLDI